MKKIPTEKAEEKILHFQTSIKQVRKADEEVDGIDSGTIIEGFASTPHVDRTNDIVEPGAFKKSVTSTFKSNPIILFQHNSSRPIGRALEISVLPTGLKIKAVIVDAEIEPKLKAEILKAFSIGFRILKSEFQDEDGNVLDMDSRDDRERIFFDPTVVRVIKEVELLEISIVSIPANANALFTLSKSVETYFKNEITNLQSKYPNMKKLKKAIEEEEKKEVKKIEEEKEETKKPSESVEETEKEETEEVEESSEEESTKGDAESQDGETSDEDDDGETSDKGKTEEESTEEEEKSFSGFQITDEMLTKENLGMALEKISELQGELKKTPVKQAEINAETKEHSKFPEKKQEETVNKGPAVKGIKSWLTEASGL